MQIEILTAPLEFQLHGLSGPVPNQNYGEVGMGLMNEMWRLVKEEKLVTTGINHWVYPDEAAMFVGIELKETSPAPQQLKPLDFQLQRYLKHVHIGPYQLLPQKWAALKAEIAARGEAMQGDSLEVYGHHCDDPAKTETIILISLK